MRSSSNIGQLFNLGKISILGTAFGTLMLKYGIFIVSQYKPVSV